MTEAHWINGEWAAGGDTFAVVNPSDTADTIGDFPHADKSLVATTAAVARAAQSGWAATGMEQRANILDAIGRCMQERATVLGEIIARDAGKPLVEAAAEAARGGQFFRYYAAEIYRLQGEFVDSVRAGVEVMVSREAAGVIGVISPWNFPLATASWKIAPALAFGNTVIWKPSSRAPAIASMLARITDECRLPAGVFNVLYGECGREIAHCGEVDAVSFTGSTKTGATVAAACAARFAKFQLEMSGKNALVVMDDADLEIAAQAALVGGYSYCGQKCTASSRLIVHRAVHDVFVDKLSALLRAQKVGDARAAGTQLGPVISAEKLEENLRYLSLAETEGCTRAFGGERLSLAADGHYMSPALLIGGRADMQINREEMFAPVACVIKADDYSHALSLANDSNYGLVAGIITRSLARAAHFRRAVRCGCVMINLPTAGTDYHVPFGGVKKSSYGPREQGKYAAEFFTVVKTAYCRGGAHDY